MERNMAKKQIKTKGNAGGIPVYCAHDKIVPVAELKPNPKNPNHHPKDQINLLAKIIKEQGWRQPITVSTRSGLVVKGHGRLMAALHVGIDSAPVDYQDYASDAAEHADLIADNRLAELAEIDEPELVELLSALDGEIDMELAGFTSQIYQNLIDVLDESFMTPDIDISTKPYSHNHFLITVDSDDQIAEEKIVTFCKREGYEYEQTHN